MELSLDGKMFVFDCNYHQKEIAKEAFFTWDPKAKIWFSYEIENAMTLVSYATEPLRSKLRKGSPCLEKKIAEQNDSYKRSFQSSSDYNVKLPAGINAYPFQKAGVEYLENHKVAILGDEMGLGKTLQSIALCNNLNLQKVLVICPSSLKLNWLREIEKFSTVKNKKVAIVTGGTAINFPLDADYIIINYEIVAKHRERLDKIKFDVMICDEAHYLKNPFSKRTRAILGNVLKKNNDAGIEAPRVLFLTGTPILNRPIELYPLLSRAGGWGSYQRFGIEYCAGFQEKIFGRTTSAWNFTGASRKKQLNSKLRSELLIRRLKSDVLHELPEKIRQVVVLPNKESAAAIREEAELWRQLQEKCITEGMNPTQAWQTTMDSIETGNAMLLKQISKARIEVAMHKIPHILEFIRNQDCQLVVFGWHREVIKALSDALKKANISSVEVTGKTKMKDRDLAVLNFQAGNYQVFVGSIKAVGVGITLTASSNVIFVELSYVPADILQAEDRCHRIGQSNCVNIKHFVYDKSVDADMSKKLIKKMLVNTEILDQNLNEGGSHE